MSLLASCVESAPGQSYFAPSSGGGGSLTSPVTITGNPNAQINLIAPTGTAAVNFGNPSTGWNLSTTNFDGTLAIVTGTATGSGDTYFVVNSDISGAVAFGSGHAGCTVTANNPFVVQDLSVANTNQILLSTPSSNQAVITGAVANTGQLSIGSSAAAPSVLTVIDVGADTANVLVGGNGGTPLQIRGGVTSPNNYSVIRPFSASGGNLQIGSSSSTNAQAIVLTDTATVIKKLGGSPQTLLTAQTIAPNATPAVPLPTGEGLYSIVGCGVGGTATAYSRQAQFSCMAYINAAGVCQMGGSAVVDLGAPGGTDSASLQVNPTGTGFNLVNKSAQSLVAFQISAFNISGPIPGTV